MLKYVICCLHPKIKHRTYVVAFAKLNLQRVMVFCLSSVEILIAMYLGVQAILSPFYPDEYPGPLADMTLF